MVAGAGLAIAARAVFGAMVDPKSGYETLGGVIGTSLAATFLYLIAALNLVVLAGNSRRSSAACGRACTTRMNWNASSRPAG